MGIINSYKRFDGESDEELIYRVASDKDLIGSWQDVADILNDLLGTEYTESKFRKQYQAFTRMLEANKDKFIDGDTELSELDDKLEEIRKERIKLQTENIERGRVDRSESRQELYYESVGKVVDTLPLPDFRPVITSRDNEGVEYVTCLADIHYGAIFKSMNNEYSPEIASQRFQFLAGELIQFVQNKQISKLKIVGLGDMIQGCLRISDLKINDSSIVKATVEVCRLVADLLNTLSAYTYVDYYHVPSANHTQIRVVGAKANELADEDLEYLTGNYIKDLCRDNDRVTVNLADEGDDYIEVPVTGSNVIAMHGHQISNLETAVRDISVLHHKFYDTVLTGHLHNGKECPAYEGVCGDAELLICPSFIGSDPYSDKIYRGSKAAVKIYGFDEVYGHTETYKIILN